MIKSVKVIRNRYKRNLYKSIEKSIAVAGVYRSSDIYIVDLIQQDQNKIRNLGYSVTFKERDKTNTSIFVYIGGEDLGDTVVCISLPTSKLEHALEIMNHEEN